MAELQPETLLDLFLETSRRARRELVGALVEKQDGGGVDIEDLDDAIEQRIEQALQVQIRECRLCNPLQVLRQARSWISGTGQAPDATRVSVPRDLVRLDSRAGTARLVTSLSWPL